MLQRVAGAPIVPSRPALQRFARSGASLPCAPGLRSASRPLFCLTPQPPSRGTLRAPRRGGGTRRPRVAASYVGFHWLRAAPLWCTPVRPLQGALGSNEPSLWSAPCRGKVTAGRRRAAAARRASAAPLGRPARLDRPPAPLRSARGRRCSRPGEGKRSRAAEPVKAPLAVLSACGGLDRTCRASHRGDHLAGNTRG
jgi:hypothetical protein